MFIKDNAEIINQLSIKEYLYEICMLLHEIERQQKEMLAKKGEKNAN